MKTPIFSNAIHEVAVSDYLTLITSFASELTTDEQYEEYMSIVDSIIDYHNGFDGHINEWLMIMPLHLSVMTSGFFIGIENDDNRAAVRGYKLILDNHLHAVAECLSQLKIYKDE